MNKNYLSNLVLEIKKAKAEKIGEVPGNTFLLENDKVLCCDRTLGESRFPYSEDGLVVWLHSTGYIDACESTFTIFRPTNYGEESAVQFFGGVKEGENYFPYSITGAGKQLFEKNVQRYMVYSLKSAICIADTEDVIFALRLYVDNKKKIHFTLMAESKTDTPKEIYLSLFMEAILRNKEHESFFEKMTKFGTIYDNGYILKSVNGNTPDCLVVNRNLDNSKVSNLYSTAARSAYLGTRGVTIGNSLSLKSGKFERCITNVTTTDLPVAADIIQINLDGKDFVSAEYELTLCRNAVDPEKVLKEKVDPAAIEKALEEAEKNTVNDYNNINIKFNGWKDGKLDSDTFNKFLRCVQNQTSFCAHGKNYAGAYLGIRDVFQQLEAALIWQRELSREKILVAMNMILTTGRPPRMFSVPASPDAPVPLDLDKYIDQGNWIISTIYTYLSYTGDWSILDEICRYLDAPDDIWIDGHDTGERTSVLEHLVRITDFLLSNIDTEYTDCLKVLFGDWNDAVDGLGTTKDEGKEFGTGVTVMATLQFRKNLFEMTEILKHVGGYDDKISEYAKVIKGMEDGLEKYAVDKDSNGNRRIVHGWGDKVGYKVGSFNDPDGASRYSLTSNAFWSISGFIRKDPTLKSSIMDCVDAVSSKYGLKTFDIPFPKDAEGVGRIVNIVPGTYENSCAYAHGSLFGAWGLFLIGESKRAWEEIEKTIVITHKNATMTSFVMPNSYCENDEYCMDGESLGDWHTGSGCVLIKEIISAGFGITPTLEGVKVQPAQYFPSESAELTLKVKDSTIHLIYKDEKKGTRTVTIDGAEYSTKNDSLVISDEYYIPSDKMSKEITIKVTD